MNNSLPELKVAQILRKYQPNEWAGTEMAVLRMLKSLRLKNVSCKIFCPTLEEITLGPFEKEGFDVCRVEAVLPLLGLTPENKAKLISVGGNLLSFQLFWALWKEPNLSLIHSHTMGLFGATAMLVACLRKIPLVVTIHGGALDIPRETKESLMAPLKGTFNWGKPFTLFLRARQLLENADLVLTCNPKEAELLKAKYPQQRIEVTRHSIDPEDYQKDYRHLVSKVYPDSANHTLMLVIGRIDPVKNQLWLVEQFPELLQAHPRLKLFLVGPQTNREYADKVKQKIHQLNLEQHIILTGAIGSDDPLLTGFYQIAKVIVLPSVAEPFGLVILEAWATGAAMIASKTSGALSLIDDRKTGWLFDLNEPSTFHKAVKEVLLNPSLCQEITTHAKEHVLANYDMIHQGQNMRKLYESTIHKE